MVRILVLTVGGLTLAIFASTYWLWFPGLSVAQTASILLADDKFGQRAFTKAVWHGDSTIVSMAQQTNGFQHLDFHQTRVITRLLLERETHTQEVVAMARELLASEHPSSFVIGALILAQTKPLSMSEVKKSETVARLYDLVSRDCSLADQIGDRCEDYLGEAAMYALAYIKPPGATAIIKATLSNSNYIPGWRKKAAEEALTLLQQ